MVVHRSERTVDPVEAPKDGREPAPRKPGDLPPGLFLLICQRTVLREGLEGSNPHPSFRPSPVEANGHLLENDHPRPPRKVSVLDVARKLGVVLLSHGQLGRGIGGSTLRISSVERVIGEKIPM